MWHEGVTNMGEVTGRGVAVELSWHYYFHQIVEIPELTGIEYLWRVSHVLCHVMQT